jgi:hypothetical protein
LGRPIGPQKKIVEKYMGQVMMGIPCIWFILWAALVLVGIFPTVCGRTGSKCDFITLMLKCACGYSLKSSSHGLEEVSKNRYIIELPLLVLTSAPEPVGLDLTFVLVWKDFRMSMRCDHHMGSNYWETVRFYRHRPLTR